MKSIIKRLVFVGLLPFVLSASAPVSRAASDAPPVVHSFRVENGHFLLDGKPFQIISGEVHYSRIPRPYWHARLRMAKAMGLNTISTYVFWNVHEPKPGVYDFTGQNDIAEFIREAGAEGLHVILRPGPYVCAEWEWGGLPAWLLKQPGIVVRSADPKFTEPARRWLKRLGFELEHLQIGDGGPIIAVQVENEYGSFGNDHAYMEQIHHALIEAGFNRSLLYTADGPEELAAGSLPELPAAINFGSGEAKNGFQLLRNLRPEGPFMAGEYWAGWFDHWGERHHTTDARREADELGWMLSQGYSVNIYMFHGGTSFGWMNGANFNGSKYQPDVTSYDYDAPLDEGGRPTLKYMLFRASIATATGVVPPAIPSVEPAVNIPSFPLNASLSLWNALSKPIDSSTVKPMEDFDQAYGYILYRKDLHGPVHGDLELDQLHDYAQIYANGKLLGSLDRRLQQNRIAVDFKEPDTRLDILVQNSGRINFGPALRNDRKGITDQVTLNGIQLTRWRIYSLPMDEPGRLKFREVDCSGPCFHKGTFKLDQVGDSFLDTSAFSKGFVWINGHPLGRIWSIGPEKTLYLPGSWLRLGENEVVVFDLDGRPGRMLAGDSTPLLNGAPNH